MSSKKLGTRDFMNLILSFCPLGSLIERSDTLVSGSLVLTASRV